MPISRSTALAAAAFFLISTQSSWALFKKPVPPPADPKQIIPALTLERSIWETSADDDRDGDCLNDDAEHALAMYYRPYYVFDSRENARRADEPLSLYRVHGSQRREKGCAVASEVELELRYAHLYRDDGGFASSMLCGNGHHGDNQAVGFNVKVSADGRTFKLVRANIGNHQWPKHRVYFFEFTHPMVYLSAGKHHEYVDMTWNGKGYPNYFLGCHEGLNGQGFKSLAVLESSLAPRGRNNVGERLAHPIDFFVNDLGSLGFQSEHAWGTTRFCGGYGAICKKDTSSMEGIWGE